MKPFDFYRPQTIADAVRLLREHPEAKLLSGGQSLLPVLKLELAAPSALITLARVDTMRGIVKQPTSVVIGALATHAEVAASPVVQQHIPALATLAGHIGDAQVRNRGTLGGSVAHADPAADYPAALLALGAIVKTDRRSIPAADFFTGLFETCLEPDELVTACEFPVPARAGYAKFASQASRYALVGVMVAQGQGADVRVAVTGAGPQVFRVAGMEAALAKRFAPDALHGIAVPADDLTSDREASADYRAHLIGVMARRAVTAALA